MAKQSVEVNPKVLPEQALQNMQAVMGQGAGQAKRRERTIFEDLDDLRTQVEFLQSQAETWAARFAELDEKYVTLHERIDSLHPEIEDPVGPMLRGGSENPGPRPDDE